MRVFPRAILHCSSRVTAIVSHDTSATSGRKRKTRVPIPHGTIIKYIAKNKKKIAHVNKHVLNTIMLSFLLHNKYEYTVYTLSGENMPLSLFQANGVAGQTNDYPIKIINRLFFFLF